MDEKEVKKITLKEFYKKRNDMEKNVKWPKIFIGIVTSVHKMYCMPQFMKGLKDIDYPNFDIMIVDNSPDEEAMNFCRSMRELGHTVIHLDRVKYTRENLVNSENYLLKYFNKYNTEHPDDPYDYFLSIESDVIPPKDVIQRLLENQVSCVSAVYMNGKVYPPKQGQNHELHTWIPMAWQYPIDGIPELNVLRPMEVLRDIVPSRLIRCQSTGLGCLLIARHVMEKFAKVGGFKVELDSVACSDMYMMMSITQICDNPDCDYVHDKYIHKCPKCGSHCVWSYLDTKTWCRHDHQEWTPDLRKHR